MKGHIVSFLALALLGTAACSRSRPPAAAPPPGDLDQLQGAWRIEASWWNGAPEPAAARSVTIHFRGDKCIVVDKDGNGYEETIALMPERNPKAIDRWGKDG